jgi:hypothetical protein
MAEKVFGHFFEFVPIWYPGTIAKNRVNDRESFSARRYESKLFCKAISPPPPPTHQYALEVMGDLDKDVSRDGRSGYDLGTGLT